MGDPADFILQKLATHRVVMVADAGHGDPLYYRAVVATLNRWISAFDGKPPDDTSGNLPRRLILAMEIDSGQAQHLNDFIRAGDRLQGLVARRWLGRGVGGLVGDPPQAVEKFFLFRRFGLRTLGHTVL